MTSTWMPQHVLTRTFSSGNKISGAWQDVDAVWTALQACCPDALLFQQARTMLAATKRLYGDNADLTESVKVLEERSGLRLQD
jgi:hypothetical protein